MKMNKIMEFNSIQVTEESWISNLVTNPGLAILLVDGLGKLILLHNLCYLQENLFCSETKILGLCGIKEKAEVYRIDSKSASMNLELPVPAWRELKGAQSEMDVLALTVPDQNPTTARFKNSLWIPPLVSNTIMEAKSLMPLTLIPLLSSRFQEFDKSSSAVKVCTVLCLVLEYLWAVQKKLVPTTIVAVDSSVEAVDWSARHHFACISGISSSSLPPPPPFVAPPVPSSLAQDPALSSMTDELRRIRDATERHLLCEVQAADSKKDLSGWEKLPDMVQNMILKLSAIQDNILPLDPCESYSKVLKQSKILGVTMVLNLEMRLRKCQVDILTAMANAIKTGNFQANSYLVAHSFSIFNVPFMDAAQMTSCNKTELDILDEGEGIPKDIARKLAENKFNYPDTTHLLRHQLNNWYGILQICFGDKSIVAREARTWVTHVDEFELAYNAHFKIDQSFGA